MHWVFTVANFPWWIHWGFHFIHVRFSLRYNDFGKEENGQSMKNWVLFPSVWQGLKSYLQNSCHKEFLQGPLYAMKYRRTVVSLVEISVYVQASVFPNVSSNAAPMSVPWRYICGRQGCFIVKNTSGNTACYLCLLDIHSIWKHLKSSENSYGK